MKKGSEDIRILAVRNVLEKKYTIPQVAELTGYSIATIYNWVRIYKKEKAVLKYSVDTISTFSLGITR